MAKWIRETDRSITKRNSERSSNLRSGRIPFQNTHPRRIGIISDTHGLLRPEALDALRRSELIIHSGDIGGKEIVDALSDIAPVIAVRGNTDRDGWVATLPEAAVIEGDQALIYVLHDIHSLDLNPAVAGFRIVVSGHSHQPSRSERDGVLYLNPGSAGPKRFKLPITLACIDLEAKPWKIEFIDLGNSER